MNGYRVQYLIIDIFDTVAFKDMALCRGHLQASGGLDDGHCGAAIDGRPIETVAGVAAHA